MRHVYGMKLTVPMDASGRVVLPKKVREALGIRGASKLRVDVIGDRAEISLAAGVPAPTRKQGGRLVFTGPLPEEWDSGAAVLAVRAGRVAR